MTQNSSDSIPLTLTVVALRRRKPRPGNLFFASDVVQWWLYPDVDLPHEEANVVYRFGDITTTTTPMLAEIVTKLKLSQFGQRDLVTRLATWTQQGFPARNPSWPLLGFLVRHGMDEVVCTAGYHPTHQMVGGYSPFWFCSPVLIERLKQLRRQRISIPGYVSDNV